MKFSHIADAHVGSWRDPKLRELSLQSFLEAVDESLRENVDFILISGDLFNTALPSIEHIRLVIRKLKEAKEKDVQVYFIAGSHDFSPSGKTMLDIIEEAGLAKNVMDGNIDSDGRLQLKFTIDNKTGAKLSGILGEKGMLDRNYYRNLDKSTLESEKGFKIFLFHTSIDEMKPSYLSEMESSPLSFLPKHFDYYAGGHVHIVENKNFSESGYKNVIYPGPTFPASFSEMEKLKNGGFFIYDDGKIIRKELKLKDTISIFIDAENKQSNEVKKILDDKIKDINPADKIILIRIAGRLSSGRPSDICIEAATENAYRRGAYFVMKNTSKLLTQDFSEAAQEHSSPEEIEEKIISANLNQIANNFPDEKQTTKKLLHAFSEEKHEAEKNSDYELRIKKNIDEILK